MDMIHIEKWLPRPGELLEFVPATKSLQAAAAAPASSVPASLFQEFHIRYWRDRRELSAPNAPDLRTELSMCFSIATPLDRTALRAAFTEFLRRHDSLRCWFAVGDTTMIRHLLAPEAITLKTVTDRRVDSSETLRARLAARFEAPDPTVWPAFACGAIDHGTDGFTVYFSVDHAFSDGVSLIAALYELHHIYAAYTADREPTLPAAGDYIDYASEERATIARQPPELERLANIIVDMVDDIRPTPWDLGLAPGEFGDSTGLRFDVLTGAEVDRFVEICSAAGGSVVAGIYAAIALTELELIGRTKYLGLNVIGTRSDRRFRFTQGWFLNLVPIALQVGPTARFSDVIGHAHTTLSAVEPLAAIPLPAAMARAAELLGRELPPVRDWPWVSYLDMRPISGATLEQSMPGLSGIHSLGSSARISQPSTLRFNREHDRVHVAVMFPDTALAHTSVTIYLEKLRAVLRTIAEFGDFVATATAAEVS